MHMSPPCISTGVLNKTSDLYISNGKVSFEFTFMIEFMPTQHLESTSGVQW